MREGDYPAQLLIVGVVGDIRKHGYARDPQPTVYWCGVPWNPNPEFLVRTSGDPLRLSEAVRQRMRAIEPNRAVYDVKRLSDSVSSTLTERRFQMLLLSSFAATALLLAVSRTLWRHQLPGVAAHARNRTSRRAGRNPIAYLR